VTDVRQLSGGERSYTTLCLLLALGTVIETPFRLMDEYDVFLDEVSRQVTLTEILRYAADPQQNRRQFIIITPNNLNNIKTSDRVKIQRMAKVQYVTHTHAPSGVRIGNRGFLTRLILLLCLLCSPTAAPRRGRRSEGVRTGALKSRG